MTTNYIIQSIEDYPADRPRYGNTSLPRYAPFRQLSESRPQGLRLPPQTGQEGGDKGWKMGETVDGIRYREYGITNGDDD